MSGTNNLGIDQIEENQSSPEVPINDAFGRFDAALTETLDVDLTSGNATVSTANTQTHQRLNATSATSAGRTVTLPAIKRLVLVTNDNATSTKAISVVRGSTSVSIEIGNTALCYTDGTTNGLTVLMSASVLPHDVSAFLSGPGYNAQTILRFKCPRAFTLPASLTGSYVTAGVAATGSTTYTLKRAGSSIGTAVFSASGTTAALTFASAVTFAAGDLFEILGPATADATLADIAFNLKGSR